MKLVTFFFFFEALNLSLLFPRDKSRFESLPSLKKTLWLGNWGPTLGSGKYAVVRLSASQDSVNEHFLHT